MIRKTASVLAKTATSGLLLYFAVGPTNIATAVNRLGQADLRWIAFGLLVLLVQAVIAAMRWKLIVNECGCGLTLMQSFLFNMIALFFNQSLPSSVGGDAIRIWLVGSHGNWRVAAYSVFLDRVIGVVTLATLVVILFPWTFQVVHDPIGRFALLSIGLGCITAGLVFITLGWKKLPILESWSLTRHLAAAATIAAEILRTPRVLASIISLSVLVHVFTVLAAWCAARSVGSNVSPVFLLFLVLPVVLIASVPISIAGWGVREGAMAAAFAYAGLLRSDGLITSLVFGALYLLLGVAGGIVWVLSKSRISGTAVEPVPHIE